MKVIVSVALAGALAASLAAQEEKPVPKNSLRVYVPGCSKGYIFTAGPRAEDRPGVAVPTGTHLRMSGPKEMLAEIRAREGSLIELTGLVKKGQIAQDGVQIAPGVRMTGGTSQAGGSNTSPNSGLQQQVLIDVEGWRRIAGECPR